MKDNINWIYKVFLLSFILSLLFSGGSSAIANSFNTIILAILIILVIAIGIIFDMIGVAVLTSEEANLHAKASKKLKGAKEAIYLLKNATKVSSICQDVIGDICGIVSGSLGAVLTLNISEYFDWNIVLVTMIVTALISALTVGGKAIFKVIATENADSITHSSGKIISIFSKNK